MFSIDFIVVRERSPFFQAEILSADGNEMRYVCLLCCDKNSEKLGVFGWAMVAIAWFVLLLATNTLGYNLTSLHAKSPKKRSKGTPATSGGFGGRHIQKPAVNDALEEEDADKLDKWGLPAVPTHESIFPPSLREIKPIDRHLFPIDLTNAKFGMPASPELLRQYVTTPHLSTFVPTTGCFFLNLEPAVLYFPSFVDSSTCRAYIQVRGSIGTSHRTYPLTPHRITTSK